MAGFENIAKKAFYMGVGFASYAQEKANDTLKDLRVQAQKLADEMAARGEMSAEEARKFVDDLVDQAQQGVPNNPSSNKSESRQPRRIEIVDEDETPQSESGSEATKSPPFTKSSNDNDDLRQQVQSLQEELRRLKKEM